MAAFRIGTASWSDPGFIRDWYPPHLAPSDRLRYYAQHFDTVEVNSSFYAIPSERQTESWANSTPDGFLFHIKLHRLLSRHGGEPESLPPDLRDSSRRTAKGRVELTPSLQSELARRYAAATLPLANTGKLGLFLLQLAPWFEPAAYRLENLAPILETLLPTRTAIEFRNRAWLDPRHRRHTLDFLRAHNAPLVGIDGPRTEHPNVMPPEDPAPDPDTGYLRLHGRNARGFLEGRSVAERFDYLYSPEELAEIAARARSLAARSREVTVIFNNNHSDYAPKNAASLKRLLADA